MLGRDTQRVDPYSSAHVGGCQNYGPFLGTIKNRCRIILRTQKGTIILTTTHVLHSNNPHKIKRSKEPEP